MPKLPNAGVPTLLANEPPRRRGRKPGFKPAPSPPPVEPQNLKELKALSKSEFVRVGEMLMRSTLAELRVLAEDESGTCFFFVVAAQMAVKMHDKGDNNAYHQWLDRLIGRVPQPAPENPFTAPVERRPQLILTLPDNGRSAKK